MALRREASAAAGGMLPRRVLLRRLGGLTVGSVLAFCPRLAAQPRATAGSRGDTVIRFAVAAGEEGRFLAWPANNGCWSWDGGREVLVGYTEGPWVEKEGHRIGSPQINRLARTRDGGLTWVSETPNPFVGRAGDPQQLEAPICFEDGDLALRVVAGEAGSGEERLGGFFVSPDRGQSWGGPFPFAGLESEPALKGLVLTSRTCYRITGERSAQVFLSAQDPQLGRHSSRLDKTFVASTEDGGRQFRFVAWVVPWSDPYRAVMPSLASLGADDLITVLRRKDPRSGEDHPNWIEAYGSTDAGASWSSLGRVAETGIHNGNPGALVRLRDGRLACAYANRSRQQLLLRFSGDRGRTWGPEVVIRDNPFSYDMGYPQMVENHRGELLVLYYLATGQRPHAYIEAALVPATGT